MRGEAGSRRKATDPVKRWPGFSSAPWFQIALVAVLMLLYLEAGGARFLSNAAHASLRWLHDVSEPRKLHPQEASHAAANRGALRPSLEQARAVMLSRTP